MATPRIKEPLPAAEAKSYAIKGIMDMMLSYEDRGNVDSFNFENKLLKLFDTKRYQKTAEHIYDNHFGALQNHLQTYGKVHPVVIDSFIRVIFNERTVGISKLYTQHKNNPEAFETAVAEYLKLPAEMKGKIPEELRPLIKAITDTTDKFNGITSCLNQPQGQAEQWLRVPPDKGMKAAIEQYKNSENEFILGDVVRRLNMRKPMFMEDNLRLEETDLYQNLPLHCRPDAKPPLRS